MNNSILIEYKSSYSLREKVLLNLLTKVIPIHAFIYRNRKLWNLSTNDLLSFPTQSLGYRLGIFLKNENLEPIPRVEYHDVYHILLDFSTTLEDESAMQFFLIGNGKLSPFTTATAILSGLVFPEKANYFMQQFKRGRRAKCIAKWNFKELLNENFNDLKVFVFSKDFNNDLLKKTNQ